MRLLKDVFFLWENAAILTLTSHHSTLSGHVVSLVPRFLHHYHLNLFVLSNMPSVPSWYKTILPLASFGVYSTWLDAFFKCLHLLLLLHTIPLQFSESSWTFMCRGEKGFLISLEFVRFIPFVHFFHRYVSGNLPFHFLYFFVACMFTIK